MERIGASLAKSVHAKAWPNAVGHRFASKIVQQAVVTILNQIYEVDFRGFSYRFRAGRSPHQALDALNVSIERKRVNWILDADIRGFFDHVSHEWMMKFVAHRVADKRILRLIGKWLKAGVSEQGKWSETTAGTPQGAVISPLLANVYLHYVLTFGSKHGAGRWRAERWWWSVTLTIWWSALSGAKTLSGS